MAFLDMAFIERDSARLHYRVVGSGPVMLLQHPLTADHSAYEFNGVLDSLVDAGFCCVTPDAAAHGLSSDPAPGPRLHPPALARDVLAIADAVGAEKFGYVGYSLGGCIGVQLAQLAPERLRSIYIAGWDPRDGALSFTQQKTSGARRAEFNALADKLSSKTLSKARRQAWLTIYETLFARQPPVEVFRKARRVRFASGKHDPYFANAMSAAAVLDAPFDALEGDHMSAFGDPALAANISAHARAASTGASQ